jgi:hypothetical protein
MNEFTYVFLSDCTTIEHSDVASDNDTVFRISDVFFVTKFIRMRMS